MIEQRLRDGLRDALVKEPPLRIDPDQLVDTARQRTQRRRAVSGAFVATAVLAAGVVGASGALTREDGIRSATPKSTSTVPAKPATTSGEASRHLGESLARAVEDVVPGARAKVDEKSLDRYELGVHGWLFYEAGGKRGFLEFTAMPARVCASMCKDKPTLDAPSDSAGVASGGVGLVVSRSPVMFDTDPRLTDPGNHEHDLSDRQLEALLTDDQLTLPSTALVTRLERAETAAVEEDASEAREREEELKRLKAERKLEEERRKVEERRMEAELKRKMVEERRKQDQRSTTTPGGK